MSEHLDAALTLVGEGRPVFPCIPGGKSPITKHGYLDASTDVSLIRTWWSRWPDANVGSPTGLPHGPDVIDIDVRPNGDGWAAFRRARAASLLNGWTQAVRTPSGGLHLYFPGTDQRNGSIPRAHIDFRGVGGYVLVPPSRVLVAGRAVSYRVVSRSSRSAEPVSWTAVRNLLNPRAAQPDRVHTTFSPSPTLDALEWWLRSQPEGNRNAALFWAACRAAEMGACNPVPLITASVEAGLDHREAARTVASAYRRVGSRGHDQRLGPVL